MIDYRNGFSLIELIVAMAVMGILIAIATLPFNEWRKKAAIESQTRMMLTVLNSERLEAITGKQRRSIVLNPGSYSLKRYTSVDEKPLEGTVVYTNNLQYQIGKLNGNFGGEHIVFDSRGLIESLNPPTIRTLPSYSGAAFDCIVVSVARNNIGKVEKVSNNDKCLPK